MRAIVIGFLCLTLCLTCKQTSNNELENASENPEVVPDVATSKRPQLAILGTFHFANTTDYSAIVLEDLHSEKRQEEIQNIIAILKAYKPTKILVEREPSFQDTLNNQYIEYTQGAFELPDSEVYQIGFRLADALNHSKVYGVDYRMNLGDEALVTYLNSEGLMEDFGAVIGEAQAWAKAKSAYLKSHTLGACLAGLNTPESDAFNKNLYLDKIMNISKETPSPASDFVANWWKRNITIKKHIDAQLTSDERLLLIIGAGHSALLKDFYQSSQKVELIELGAQLAP